MQLDFKSICFSFLYNGQSAIFACYRAVFFTRVAYTHIQIIQQLLIILSKPVYFILAVLLKRESKNLEKKISLYESNPTHYREFMEPPPAYEYVVPANTEKSQESSSEFLQNRQRISRISRTISTMRFDQLREAKAANQSASKQPTQPGGSTSRAEPRSGKPPHSRVLVRTRSN